MQAQHKGLGPPLHHKYTHMHTPGMNLGGDKALIERDYRWWSKGCVCVCKLCVLTCVWNQKPEQELMVFYTLWRRSGDRRYRLQVQSSWGGGGLGEPFRSADPQTAGAHGD